MIRKDALSGPGFLANADALMVSSIENHIIKTTVHKTNAFEEIPRAEDLDLVLSDGSILAGIILCWVAAIQNR